MRERFWGQSGKGIAFGELELQIQDGQFVDSNKFRGDLVERKNYLIMLGAPKCGTTSLATWLGEQPYAAVSREKETLYFTDFAERSWQGPGAHFAENRPLSIEAFDAEYVAKPQAELRIEASTDNLSCPAAVENIARFVERDNVGKFWLIAILRDPVERIISEYEHTLRLGWQTGSLLSSLEIESERARKGFNPLFRHVERSRYFSQLSRYRAIFGNQLLILDFHRIAEAGERRRMLNWMGYTDEAASDLQHSNKRRVVARPGTVGLLRNEGLVKLGRTIFPKSTRPIVRKWITGGNVGRYAARDEEIKFIRNSLENEIGACVEANDIPTDNWSVSLSH